MFHYASPYNWNSLIIKILENFNVNINAPDNNGQTLLHYVPHFYHREWFKLLLAQKDI